MVATAPIELLNTSFPITECRVASISGANSTNSRGWSDIDQLALNFNETDSGNFLVTLSIPRTTNDLTGCGAMFRLVSRPKGGSKESTQLAQGYYTCAAGGQIIPFSLVCQAEVVPTRGGLQIVAQWATFNNFKAGNAGTARIFEGLSSLSAVGSLALKKEAFTDTNHFEYPELFSRGLRLTHYSEVLFLTGYSATAAIRPLKFKGIENVVLDAAGQMQWIVDHLDEFFKTISYADGSGVYSKHDIVYFDLVIDKTVGAKAQTAVLKVLESWFKDVDPKPSTGILKKIQALAFASTKVEIEFILAH